MSLRSRASRAVPLLLGAFALASFNSVFVAHGTPVIIRQPVTVMDEIGKVSSLSVEATGDGPITYQWMTVGFDPNGHGADELYYPISGETNAVFTPGRLGPDSYAVAIYDQTGAVTSQLARIEVRDQVSLDAVAAWPGFPVKSTTGVLRDKTAFVFATDLHVIDISNPVEPRTLGIVDLQGQTRPARMIDAALSGPLLFG